MGWKRGGFIVAAISLLAAASITLASRFGASPGFSSGRLSANGIGANCTACHPFNPGTGRVELLGAPSRYLPGRVYDLTVRVIAPDEAGAGFQISAEGWAQYAGTLMISDGKHTQFAQGNASYVTHTSEGVSDSEANWDVNDGSYAYHLRWQAPDDDAGEVTFFAAVNALGTNGGFSNVRYYANRSLSYYAVPGDADGDTDLDLYDFAALQRCFDDEEPFSDPDCAFVDASGDGVIFDDDVADFVLRLSGPTTTLPGEFFTADPYRGGALYDQWWAVLGSDPPADDHPLYPALGPQSGPTTHRCKECHGWDYKGRDGAYGPDNVQRYTGIGGVYGTSLSPRELFNLLASDPAEVPDGHDMRALGMADRDLWDVVRFTVESTLDTDDYIAADGSLIGDADIGGFWYELTCLSCHGPDGKHIPLGHEGEPLGVGDVARGNPWEFLHKVRFGHPGSPMPSLELLGLDASVAADIGAYAQTLPD